MAETAQADLRPGGPPQPGEDLPLRLDGGLIRERLAGRRRGTFSLPGFRPAAVLVAYVEEEGAPDRVILTVREDGLRTHGGQVAFPGGGRDPADTDARMTALRESAEEIGLPAERAEVLGLLDDCPTPSRFLITPVVARVAGPIALRPASSEVKQIFLADVPSLLDPNAYRMELLQEFLGVQWPMHEYHFGGLKIWGATARFLHQLFETAGLPLPGTGARPAT